MSYQIPYCESCKRREKIGPTKYTNQVESLKVLCSIKYATPDRITGNLFNLFCRLLCEECYQREEKELKEK